MTQPSPFKVSIRLIDSHSSLLAKADAQGKLILEAYAKAIADRGELPAADDQGGPAF